MIERHRGIGTGDPQGRDDGPGRKLGNVGEMTFIGTLKPGGAKALREMWTGFRGGGLENLRTIHDVRLVIFDNDTRMMFGTTYDGSWDAYIDDFAVFGADAIDNFFQWFEGYPEGGIKQDLAGVKTFLKANQLTCDVWYCEYGNLTVKEIERLEKLNTGWQQMLDASQ
jgi:hypothetical protein